MSTNSSSVQARSLWMGDIESWMNEDFIKNIFKDYDVRNVKIIRDKTKPTGTGYCFIEFDKVESADHALQNYNGRTIPNTTKVLKLNWASYSASKTISTSTTQSLSEYTIYVADLDLSVTEDSLKNFFSNYYNSIITTKIIIDPSTKVSKGYGFVKFADQKESQRAIAEMNGKILNGKALKTNQASFKKMSPDFSSSMGQKNNYYKYGQQSYGANTQTPYNMGASSYGTAYPGYYDYSAYNYQPYYQQSNQYAYPYNYQNQVAGYDQNAQYQQLLMQSLAGQQGYPQGTVPGVQGADLTAQYQAQTAGYPASGYGYDYSQAMYQMNPQAQMQIPQIGNPGDMLLLDNKKQGGADEKK